MNCVPVKALVLVVACCCETAHASSLVDTLTAFGFFGTWAVDCTQPASPLNNYRSAYVSPTGDPVFTESLGPASDPNIYVVLGAKRESDDTIVVRVKINGEFEQDLTMRKEGSRLRTTTNRDVGKRERFVVRNGAVLSTGNPTPWLTRCDQPPAPSQPLR